MADPGADPGPTIDAEVPDRATLRLVGLLLVGGFLINLVVTMLWHPSGEEDNHPKIFTEYANADGWILAHLGQFLGVVTAMTGLYLLCRFVASPGRLDPLARLAGLAFIAAGVTYGILQAVDGIALKYTTEAWLEASGPAKEIHFADAETVRYTEWGVQSYFRIFFGLGLILVGAAVATRRVLTRWLGWLAIVAGALSIAVGIDVGYAGLSSSFQDVASPLLQLILAVFVIGILVLAARKPHRTGPD
jgi:hypothetical protein